MFARLIRSVRNRPAHERRILATTLFLSTSAIVIAIWITSLARTLGSQSDTERAGAGAANAQAATIASSEDAIASPFETLKQSMQQIAEGVREIRSAWQDPGAAPQEPAPPETATTIHGDGAEYVPEPAALTERGDWAMVTLFVAWLGAMVYRRRQRNAA